MSAPLAERPVPQGTAQPEQRPAEPVATSDTTRPRGRGRRVGALGLSILAVSTLAVAGPRPVTLDGPHSGSSVALASHSTELPAALATEPSPVTNRLLERFGRHTDRFARLVLGEFDRVSQETPGDTFHTPDGRDELGSLASGLPPGPVEVSIVRWPGKAPGEQQGNSFGIVAEQTDASGTENVVGVGLMELRTEALPPSKEPPPPIGAMFQFLTGGRRVVATEASGFLNIPGGRKVAFFAGITPDSQTGGVFSTDGARDSDKDTDQLTHRGLTQVIRVAETNFANGPAGLSGIPRPR